MQNFETGQIKNITDSGQAYFDELCAYASCPKCGKGMETYIEKFKTPKGENQYSVEIQCEYCDTIFSMPVKIYGMEIEIEFFPNEIKEI